MNQVKGKRHMLALIAGSRLSPEEKRSFINELLVSGEVTEHDVAEIMAGDIEKNLDSYAEVIRSDEVLRFLWERFRDRPAYLARALVQARPEIFYCYGFAFRLSLKLRADLGIVWVPPRHPGAGGGGSAPDAPLAGLPQAVEQNIFGLEVECRFREHLYFFNRSFDEGLSLLDEEISRAQTGHERRVLRAARKLAADLIKMPLPGVRTEFNGSPFPGLHVRWWLDAARTRPRLLNMGDTGSYKTSFAAIAMRVFGCKRTLVLCAPHARENWQRELLGYFTAEDEPSVRVVENRKDLDLDTGEEFTIVGYSALVHEETVTSLCAGGYDGLIQDECQYGKSIGTGAAKRALATLRLTRELPLKRFTALSATPWENRPEEIAALAVALRPELFSTPESFLASGAAKNPRLLRELFSEQILEIELREVTDLPPITPRPWEDLFGAVPVQPFPRHRAIYARVHDDESEKLRPAEKALRLLLAATHPPLLAGRVTWPTHAMEPLKDWRVSTKLDWLKRFITERIATQKIVIGSGLYAEGITRMSSEDDETPWVAQQLRTWFGKDQVLVLDGTVGLHGSAGEASPRELLIRRWRTDPDARILLVSMQACPDSVNLTVGRLPGVERLAITALSFGWKPWKQFLGRFWRQGQGVPVEYRVPVLVGTIDDDLLRLNRAKWHAQQLFRALVPVTDRELAYLRIDAGDAMRELLRDAFEHVNMIAAMLRGRGEDGCDRVYGGAYGATSRAEAFARHFVEIEDFATSGHVARFQKTVIDRMTAVGMVDPDRILDGGCGPLTLERRLNAPVHGIDMNPHMIELGKALSPHQGKNASVGRLSAMPKMWKHAFHLVCASLVLDFSSIDAGGADGPERLRILRELVRVAHPHGMIWLTWNESTHTDQTLAAWSDAIARTGMSLVPGLCGLVRATDHREQPFAFWSLAFSPNGLEPRFPRVDDFRFAFELERVRRKRGGNGNGGTPPKKRRIQHERFEVLTADGAVTDAEASRQSILREVSRWAAQGVRDRRLGRDASILLEELGSDWRVLRRLHELGIIQV
ncbi:methyltransferase domain-containing protein [Patescibacteria group bacterium]|nr:MAG: methyltransferase domain-containing protein [Patescibacteria group bacterium]